MEDYGDTGIDQSAYPGLKSGYLFSGNGTQADYEGQLRMKRLQNAIAEEDAKNQDLYDKTHPDPLVTQLAGRKIANDYERSLPAGSASRMDVSVPDSGGGTDYNDSTGAIEGRVASDPSMAGWTNGPRAIERRMPLGGETQGEVVGTGLEREKYRPLIEKQYVENQGGVDRELATAKDVDPIIYAKYKQKFDAVNTSNVPEAQKDAARQIIRQKMLQEQIDFRKLGARQKADPFAALAGRPDQAPNLSGP